MSLTHYPNGLTSFGIPVLPPVGPGVTTGSAFFVHSGTGSNGYKGTDPPKPFATIDYAIGQCTASKGDVVYVMPGHTENLAAADAIDIDVAGVSVIGLGWGSLRPILTFTNAAGEVVIGASNVRISNIVFNASVTAVLKAIDIEASKTDAIIDHCYFTVVLAGTDEFNNSIIIGDQANRSLIYNNEFHMGTAGAVSAIYSDADNDYCKIAKNLITGDYSTACIVGDEADDMIVISDNRLYNGQATGVGLNSEPCIELAATTTGIIEHNRCFCNLATKAASIVADDCHLHENYYNEDESSAATSGIIGTASADD